MSRAWEGEGPAGPPGSWDPALSSPASWKAPAPHSCVHPCSSCSHVLESEMWTQTTLAETVNQSQLQQEGLCSLHCLGDGQGGGGGLVRQPGRRICPLQGDLQGQGSRLLAPCTMDTSCRRDPAPPHSGF